MARVKKISLGLQGGGAHGAFTWGVLDRLLEEERLDIEAVSGASAGAVNAVALAHGYATGGREGAKEALDKLWHRVGGFGEFSPFRRSWLDVARQSWGMELSPTFLFYDVLSRMASPYDLNPFNFGVLEHVLDFIDWEAVRRSPEFKVFVAATNVRSGKVKVFEQRELSLKAVLASTCLPQVFQAVEIDGEAYWDGGFLGNPPLFPLFYVTSSCDILVIEINTLYRADVPRTAHEINERLNEINFNSALLAELRAIEFVGRLVDRGAVDTSRYRKMLVHMIDGGCDLAELGSASKLNAEMEFLQHLKAIGRRRADEWVRANFEKLGVESSVDLRELVG